MIWLPRGLTRDSERFGTRGHVDIVAAFTAPGRLLLHTQTDERHPDALVCRQIRDSLGERFEIVELPAPAVLTDDEGFVDYSYINHLVVNGGVIACAFGDPRDADAAAILAEQYPGRTVVSVDARPLFARGGGTTASPSSSRRPVECRTAGSVRRGRPSPAWSPMTCARCSGESPRCATTCAITRVRPRLGDNRAVTDVLIAGAGPIGLTAAIELARRGVAVRIVDPLPEPAPYAKAVGVQPRTLEVFERMGIARQILDAAVPLRGQLIYVNGEPVDKLELALPADVPFGFIGIPQYATERVLRAELAGRGVRIERGVRLTGFEQDDDGVTAMLTTPGRCGRSNLFGADGAHSIGAQDARLSFDGAASPSRTCSRCRGRLVAAGRTPCGPCTAPMTPSTICCCAIPLPGRGGTGCRCWCRRSSTAPGAARFRRRPAARTAPHPGGVGPVVPGTDDGPEPALVLGVPDQPPHRQRLRRGRVFVAATPRTFTHPPGRRDEHRHPGRRQPGLEAGAGRHPARRWACWTAMSRAPSGRRGGGGPTVRGARGASAADSDDPDFSSAARPTDRRYPDSFIVAAGAGGRARTRAD